MVGERDKGAVGDLAFNMGPMGLMRLMGLMGFAIGWAGKVNGRF